MSDVIYMANPMNRMTDRGNRITRRQFIRKAGIAGGAAAAAGLGLSGAAHAVGPGDPNITKDPEHLYPATGDESVIYVWPQNDATKDPQNIQWAVDNIAATGGTVYLKSMNISGVPTPFYFGNPFIAGGGGVVTISQLKNLSVIGDTDGIPAYRPDGTLRFPNGTPKTRIYQDDFVVTGGVGYPFKITNPNITAKIQNLSFGWIDAGDPKFCATAFSLGPVGNGVGHYTIDNCFVNTYPMSTWTIGAAGSLNAGSTYSITNNYIITIKGSSAGVINYAASNTKADFLIHNNEINVTNNKGFGVILIYDVNSKITVSDNVFSGNGIPSANGSSAIAVVIMNYPIQLQGMKILGNDFSGYDTGGVSSQFKNSGDQISIGVLNAKASMSGCIISGNRTGRAGRASLNMNTATTSGNYIGPWTDPDTGRSYPGNEFGNADLYGILIAGDNNVFDSNTFASAGKSHVYFSSLPFATASWGITSGWQSVFHEGTKFFIDDGIHPRVWFEYDMPPNYDGVGETEVSPGSGVFVKNIPVRPTNYDQLEMARAAGRAINGPLGPDGKPLYDGPVDDDGKVHPLNVIETGNTVLVAMKYKIPGTIGNNATFASPLDLNKQPPVYQEFVKSSTPDSNLFTNNVFGPVDPSSVNGAIACFGFNNQFIKNDYRGTNLPGIPNGAPCITLGVISQGYPAGGNTVFESGMFPTYNDLETNAKMQVLDAMALETGTTTNRVVGHTASTYDKQKEENPGIGQRLQADKELLESLGIAGMVWNEATQQWELPQ